MKKIFKKIKSFFTVDTIIDFSIVAITLIFAFCTDFNVIYGDSMYPTLKDHQLTISNVIKAKQHEISRFDIVIIDVNEDKYIIKRVIGLPNETIEYVDNKLYVNGNYVEEYFFDSDYVFENDIYTNDFKITLNEDEYYCLGDNRNISRDSRFYGTFTADDFISSGVFVIFPFSDFGER